MKRHQSIGMAFLFGALVLSFRPLMALDIPLTGVSSDGKGGSKIAYVDMDRIFRVYPQTLAAKEDYAKQLKKKREQVAAKQTELAETQNRIAVLEATMKANPDPNAATPADPTAEGMVPAGLPQMRKDLDDKKLEVEEMKKQAEKDLAAFQAQQSQMILGKIYQALKDIALEEQVSVVVDKASILFGDAAIDLTDRLQERVRGF